MLTVQIFGAFLIGVFSIWRFCAKFRPGNEDWNTGSGRLRGVYYEYVVSFHDIHSFGANFYTNRLFAYYKGYNLKTRAKLSKCIIFSKSARQIGHGTPGKHFTFSTTFRKTRRLRVRDTWFIGQFSKIHEFSVLS